MRDRSPRAVRTAVIAALLTAVALTGATACSAPDTASGQASARGVEGPVVVRADKTPKALEVPSIGLHTTTFVALGLTPAGKMDVPADATTTGWFDLGPVPGEPGPAVIVAHVNWKKVDGVFAHLNEIKTGDPVTVTRADGTAVRFTAYRVERYAKAAFPTADVYGNTAGPELRLVTCGGDFDPSTGHYKDNWVVYARP
jgi:sortase (surface protein transpeptidase)